METISRHDCGEDRCPMWLGDDDPRAWYATRDEAIRSIIDSIADDERDYDIDAIFDEAFEWTPLKTNAQGQELAGTDGWQQVVSTCEYWEIVERHCHGRKPDPVDVFRAGMIAAITALPPLPRPVTPAVWHDLDVTVEIESPSRVHHDWPQLWARIRIITPDGATVCLAGADITSWDDLWTRVQTAVDEWRASTDEALRQVQAAHRKLVRAEAEMLRARAARDAAVRDAAGRVTAYRMAHALGVAESTIGRILGKAAQ